MTQPSATPPRTLRLIVVSIIGPIEAARERLEAGGARCYLWEGLTGAPRPRWRGAPRSLPINGYLEHGGR